MKVNIKCRQVVTYNQDVEMSQDDFEKFEDSDIDVTGKDFYLLQGYIDSSDVFDAEDEYTDVEVIEIKNDKKK